MQVSDQYTHLISRKINDWQKRGLLNDETAESLREDLKTRASSSSPTMTIFAVFGSLLIGLGIITLLAFNWEQISRPLRATIAFIPLFISQALLIWIFITKKIQSITWREGVSVFQITAIGAAVSIISQTYHISNDPVTFYLTWGLLTLPLVYLLNSTSAFLAFFALIVTWYLTGAANWDDQGWITPDYQYWLLLLLVTPFWVQTTWLHNSGETRSPGYFLRNWIGVTALTVGVISTVGPLLGSPWQGGLLILSIFSVCLFLVSSLKIMPSRPLLCDPARILGATGVFVLAFFFSYDVDRAVSAPAEWFHSLSLNVMLISLLLGGGWIYFSIKIIRAPFKQRLIHSTYLGFPIVLGVFGLWLDWPWIFSLLIFAIGVASIADGVRQLGLARLNWGLFLISLLILLRLFDSSIGFLLKGVAFILIGIAFLIVNALIARRVRSQTQGAESS